MSQSKLTEASLAKAKSTLVEKNMPLTNANLLGETGGSKTTLTNLKKTLERQAAEHAPPAPEHIQQRTLGIVQEIWTAAFNAARDEIDRIRAEAQATVAIAQDDLDTSKIALAHLQALHLNLEKINQTAQQETIELRFELRQIGDLKKEISDSRAETEKRRVEAEAQAKLAAKYQGQVQVLREARGQFSKKTNQDSTPPKSFPAETHSDFSSRR